MKRSYDVITATMAAVALGCLVLLSGCGPQNGEAVAVAAPAKMAAAKPQPAPPPIVSFHLGEVRHFQRTQRTQLNGDSLRSA